MVSFGLTSQSDSNLNCTLSGSTVSCTPGYVSGQNTYSGTLALTCTSGGVSASATATISVAATNRSPVLTAISNQAVTAGSGITQIDASDGDDDSDIDEDTLSYSCTYTHDQSGGTTATDCSSLPGTFSLGTSTGILNWTPSSRAVVDLATTTYTISLTASDQQETPLTDTVSFTVAISSNAISVSRVYENDSCASTGTDSCSFTYWVDGSTTSNPCNKATSATCIQAGILRKVSVESETSCGSMTAADDLGVFSWTCSDSGGNAVFTTNGFTTNKGLQHLINATTWKSNSVTVTKGSNTLSTASSTTWWTNTIEALADSSAAVQSLSSAGKIYTASSMNNDQYGFHVTADNVAVVVLAGTLSSDASAGNSCNWADGSATGPNTKCTLFTGSDSASDKAFLWIEGTFSSGGMPIVVAYNKFSRLNQVTANSAGTYAFWISASSRLVLTNLTHSGGSLTAIELNNVDNSSFTTVSVKASTTANISVTNGSDGNTFSGINSGRMTAAAGNAIQINDSDNNVFSQVQIAGATRGIYLYNGALANYFQRVVITNVTNAVYATGSANNNSFSQLLAFAGGDSFATDGVSGLILQYATIMQNDTAGALGIYLQNGSGIIHQVAIGKNGSGGLQFNNADQGGTTYVDTVASLHNTGVGINVDANTSNPDFSGNFITGNNTGDECTISSGTSNLAAVGGNCDAGADPDITIVTSTGTLASTFAGLLTSGDSGHADHTAIDTGNGVIAEGAVTDWVNFSQFHFGWGLHTNAAPITSNAGKCESSGGNCGAWNWGLSSSDTVLKDNLTCTHARVAGLSNAGLVEILMDGIGDDDLVCETNETCLLGKNIGAYQGHGALVANTTCTPGNGITVMEYQTNGY